MIGVHPTNLLEHRRYIAGVEGSLSLSQVSRYCSTRSRNFVFAETSPTSRRIFVEISDNGDYPREIGEMVSLLRMFTAIEIYPSGLSSRVSKIPGLSIRYDSVLESFFFPRDRWSRGDK